MICLKCKTIVEVKDALIHPQNQNLLFCPVCKRLLLDFGKEFVRLSPDETLLQFDTTPNKSISKEEIINFITNTDIDIRILECTDAIKIKPDNIEARITLIKLNIAKKDFESALREIVKLEEIDGQNVTTLALLADVYAGAANYKEAIGYCLRILEIEPENTNARYNMGIALACLENYSAAANQFVKIIRQDPNNKDARIAFDRVKTYIKKKES